MELQARRIALRHGWQLAELPAGAPPGAEAEVRDWIDVPELGPVAAVLRATGRWSLDGSPRRFDASDWCYRLAFELPPDVGDQAVTLGFDGLATLATAQLNGAPLLRSDNMFIAHRCDPNALLRPGRNELVLRFASLDALLATPRPRPRWRTPMVEHQQLRWWRTTLLGRTPGWSPPAAPVGPWRDVWLSRATPLDLLDPSLDVTHEQGLGRVAFRSRLHGTASLSSARLCIARGDTIHHGELTLGPGPQPTLAGALEVPNPALWWPHTHGEPVLYRAWLDLTLTGASEPVTWPLGEIGFRSITLDNTDGRFAVRVNGVPVFCRGACWMPLDAVTLRAPAAAYRTAIAQARDAGMNMLRVVGSTVYEDDAFHDECDRQGLLVWQDFMFANLDYPADDPGFATSVEHEVRGQLQRWRARPSTAVLCGNSEVEQQAAMWGAPRPLWQPALFHAQMAGWAAELCPHVPYWPSSAHGGAFPHQADQGTTSYYGVGAYLGPLEDARRANLKFATECLGFANLPEDTALARVPGGPALPTHHPAWKARTPRDLGAGWDFEDVRDHYLAQLYGVDPPTLRRLEPERYLALGRAVTGDVMADTLAEWRRAGSGCGGALLWTMRDLWAGAGWGLLDERGAPKPCWWHVRRALQPISLAITDERHSGLRLHACNDHAEALTATLEFIAYNESDAPVAQARRAVAVPGHGRASWTPAKWLDGFLDLGHAYRFGPPVARLVWAGLHADDGRLLAQAWHFPAGRPTARLADSGLTAALAGTSDATLELTLQAEGFVQGLHIDLGGHHPDDNHFHLRPGETRHVTLHPDGALARRAPCCRLRALNSHRVLMLALP